MGERGIVVGNRCKGAHREIGPAARPAFYAQHLQALQANTLAVNLQHSLALLELPLHHRDPFDRLMIAQAREEGMALVSRDEAFRAYDVARLW